MKNLILALLLFFVIAPVYSQETDKQKAHELCLKGIDEMDKGEIENAIAFFEQAKALDPDNYFYPYEIAHAHYLTRQYKKSIQILETLLSHKDVTDHAYHLLGSNYEYSNNAKMALEIYNQGLAKFPESGILYNGLGSLSMKKKKYTEALSFFEQGIKAEPDFTNNYYWASKVHASLEDKLWGITYAELFINSEGVNEKSRELGKVIYDVYQNGIKVSGNKVTVELADADTSHKNFEHDFETTLWESADSVKKQISISSISEIRKLFLTNWMSNGNHDKYPNALFDWQYQIMLKGYWEPYHYWLLKEGNPDEFENWKSKNAGLLNDFENWLSDNHLKLSKSNYFVATQYAN